MPVNLSKAIIKFLIIEVSLINICFLFAPYAGKCVKDYYDGNLGVEQRVSSAGRPCLHAVRSYKETWLRLWFESIRISPGNFVFLALKDSKGRIKVNWNLTSNDPGLVRNFDGIEQGNWFEIEQTANVSFDLRFMSYSAG